MPNKELDLSVCVITLNEEPNIARCLASLPAGVEIIVVDSHSQDKTLDIAKKYGAKNFQRAFDDYSAQKNFALSKATRSWILSVDADEELSDHLKDKLQNICSGKQKSPHVAFRLRRRLVFMGKLMRFGKSTDYPIRLFKNGEASFEGAIHESLKLSDGATLGCLLGDGLLHYSYENLDDYFRKFNQYTSSIAQKKFSRSAVGGWDILQLFRPWFEFFVRYFVLLGFLDGYPGYCYAYLSSVYKFVNYAKLRELRQKTLPE